MTHGDVSTIGGCLLVSQAMGHCELVQGAKWEDVTNVREVDSKFPAQKKSLKDTGDIRNARDLHK